MGMYTELHFNAELVRDVPPNVIDVLRLMTGVADHEPTPSPLPDHALFRTQRWSGMLLCSSYYFPLSVATSVDFDDIAKRYYLRVRCNLKDYDGEIDHFLDWIRPYVDADDECLGYYRYEEDPHPTLIYRDRDEPHSPKEPS